MRTSLHGVAVLLIALAASGCQRQSSPFSSSPVSPSSVQWDTANPSSGTSGALEPVSLSLDLSTDHRAVTELRHAIGRAQSLKGTLSADLILAPTSGLPAWQPVQPSACRVAPVVALSIWTASSSDQAEHAVQWRALRAARPLVAGETTMAAPLEPHRWVTDDAAAAAEPFVMALQRVLAVGLSFEGGCGERSGLVTHDGTATLLVHRLRVD